jgi:hypothetical protein
MSPAVLSNDIRYEQGVIEVEESLTSDKLF